LKFIYHYIILIILLFFSLSCKLYKKEFDNPVDYIANNDLGVGAPALVFYPKTQTIPQGQSVKVESVIVFHTDSTESFTGMHLHIQFPNSLLALDTIKPGLFITDTSNSTPLFTYNFDGTNQIDIYTYFLSAIKLDIEGTGHIADIVFNSISSGTDSISYNLNNCQMININDQDIPIISSRSAEIVIQ